MISTTLRNLTDVLPMDEQNEDEGLITFGDDIALQFFYGNYTDACNMLWENNIRPNDFLRYIEEQAESWGFQAHELYNGQFSTRFWINLSESYTNLYNH